MIITRVPFRVSFFGGGTDMPVWFERHGGAVISTTIDKYCYVTARPLPPFFDHRVRLAYSRIELVSELSEIEHPLIRVALQRFDRTDIEIHYDADLPAWSGLGTSSAFAVGLVRALSGLEGRLLSKKDLAIEAIRLERHVLEESGGYQDQVAAAYGGFNHVEFDPAGDAGATGGKILGAGAGGFMLLFCPEEMQRAVRERLSSLLFVPFAFDRSGMQVIHYQPSKSG